MVDSPEGMLALKLHHSAGLIRNIPCRFKGREGKPEEAHATVCGAGDRHIAAGRNRDAAHWTCMLRKNAVAGRASHECDNVHACMPAPPLRDVLACTSMAAPYGLISHIAYSGK